MTLPELYLTLLIGGAVLFASIAAARAAHRVGLPSLLLFLAKRASEKVNVKGYDPQIFSQRPWKKLIALSLIP